MKYRISWTDDASGEVALEVDDDQRVELESILRSNGVDAWTVEPADEDPAELAQALFPNTPPKPARRYPTRALLGAPDLDHPLQSRTPLSEEVVHEHFRQHVCDLDLADGMDHPSAYRCPCKASAVWCCNACGEQLSVRSCTDLWCEHARTLLQGDWNRWDEWRPVDLGELR